MLDNKPKILFISSANPLIGPARLALDYTQAMKEYGLEVDLLTLNPVESYPEILFVKNTISNKIKKEYASPETDTWQSYTRLTQTQ